MAAGPCRQDGVGVHDYDPDDGRRVACRAHRGEARRCAATSGLDWRARGRGRGRDRGAALRFPLPRRFAAVRRDLVSDRDPDLRGRGRFRRTAFSRLVRRDKGSSRRGAVYFLTSGSSIAFSWSKVSSPPYALPSMTEVGVPGMWISSLARLAMPAMASALA